MALFTKAENTSARLKMGIMGFAGSGKTYTAAMTAIGLVEHMRAANPAETCKPIVFLDTDSGSDWVKPKIEGAGIELYTAKTRAFSDLLMAVSEAEENASILLVDSLTHFWVELCDSYMRARKRTRLQFEDWAYLKKEWRKFTDLFVNSNLHIVICGRAGYEYDYVEDENGRKQLEKTDVKMKAEGEMGYEPSLLVLMERETDMQTMRVSRFARILKDRSTRLDGQSFANPGFADFLPHIELLRLGGKQMGVDTTRSSDSTIPADGGRDNRKIQRKIALDEIQSLLVLHYPGQTAVEKKSKIELLRKHFQAAWTEMEEVMPLTRLRAGYDTLHQALEGVPSRYGQPAAAAGRPAFGQAEGVPAPAPAAATSTAAAPAAPQPATEPAAGPPVPVHAAASHQEAAAQVIALGYEPEPAKAKQPRVRRPRANGALPAAAAGHPAETVAGHTVASHYAYDLAP